MTSQFILAPGEEFVQCPYNTSHQIINTRVLIHLVKCRKQYLKSEDGAHRMSTCRFNDAHHVPNPELKFHEDRCPDAASHLICSADQDSSEKQRHQNTKNSARERQPCTNEFRENIKKCKTKQSTQAHHKSHSHLPEEDLKAESSKYEPEHECHPQRLVKFERKRHKDKLKHIYGSKTLPNEFPNATNFLCSDSNDPMIPKKIKSSTTSATSTTSSLPNNQVGDKFPKLEEIEGKNFANRGTPARIRSRRVSTSSRLLSSPYTFSRSSPPLTRTSPNSGPNKCQYSTTNNLKQDDSAS